MTDRLKETPLTPLHRELGARMGPFGGFDMPIQYEGILREHDACRREAALFDTCHMGVFRLAGSTAGPDLERLLSCRIDSLADGQCRYGLMCNEAGGVVDDCIVYRFGADDYMLVVNAGTQEKDLKWVRQHAGPRTRVEDRSAQMAKIDVQGPAAPRILRGMLADDFANLRYFRFMPARFGNTAVTLSRTGYTGEIGFELYLPSEHAADAWKAAVAGGAVPAGLGARDTLRLEAGLPLYGHELDEQRCAAQAGFTRVMDMEKAFIGAAAVRQAGPDTPRLRGLILEGRASARAGDDVLDAAERPLGSVTSGSYAPSLGHAVAMAYLVPELPAGARVTIRTARRPLAAVVCELPFYREGTARRPLSDFLRKSD